VNLLLNGELLVNIKRNERGEQLWTILRNAVINTRKRPSTLRGPYIISDEYLDGCIKKF